MIFNDFHGFRLDFLRFSGLLEPQDAGLITLWLLIWLAGFGIARRKRPCEAGFLRQELLEALQGLLAAAVGEERLMNSLPKA